MRSFAILTSAIFAFTLTTYALPHSLLQTRADDEVSISAASPSRLVAYVQTFRSVNGGPLSLLPLLQEKTGVTHILLSAVHLNEKPGDINLNDHPPNNTMYDNLWSEAKQLQEGGIKVMMMLGGAARGTFQRLSGDDKSFHAYYDPLLTILRKYKIQGIDIDIEESVPISMPLRLLRQLNADMGPDFILTMAPVASAMLGSGGNGLHGFSQKEMDNQAVDSKRPNGKLVSWYNAQLYNGWGDASTTTMYERIIEEGGWSPDRVVMGVLTNPGDGGSGFVKLPTLKSVIGSLGAKYASFGCAVGWEYWAAGTGDGIQYPWQWVKALGDVISGFAKGEQTSSSSPDTQPPSDALPPTPWPSQMATLESVGAGHWDSLRALNLTNGDTKAAGDMLNVTQLIDGILKETEDLVSGVLDSLAVV